LINKLGREIGVKYSDALSVKALRLSPTTMPEYLEALLMIDDDNGNLEDGTPSMGEICSAFYKHNDSLSFLHYLYIRP